MVVAHEILVSAQGPLVLVLGLGPGLDNNRGRYLNIIFVAGNQEMDMEDRGRDR